MKLQIGHINKLRGGIGNGGLITMHIAKAKGGTIEWARKRRMKDNQRLERAGYLIEVRGQWYVTPQGEQAVRDYEETRKRR